MFAHSASDAGRPLYLLKALIPVESKASFVITRLSEMFLSSV